MPETEPTRRLDPEQLDPEALDAATYHMTVGPALQVAADTAAKRGHPTLHDDMPAMLALIDTINQLTDRYVDTFPASAPDTQQFEQAATGACVMVLQQAEMPAEVIGQCLAALETAYRQLYEHDVLTEARPFVAMAWAHLEDGERSAARHCLEQAAQTAIAAIETWQTQVH